MADHAAPLQIPSSSTYSPSRNLVGSDKPWTPSEKTPALSFPNTKSLHASIRKPSDSLPPTVPFLLRRPLPILPRPPLDLILDQVPVKKGKLLALPQPNSPVADSVSSAPKVDTGMPTAPPTPASTAINQLLDIARTTAQSSRTLRRRRATIGTTTRTT